MAKYILEQIKIEGVVRDIISKSDGENVSLSIEGRDTTLAAEMARLLVEIATLPTKTDVDSKISAAVNSLIGGAPATYDTLKEIADYIASHADVVSALNAAIGNKVDKEAGKGLSANDFTNTLKTKLEGLSNYTHPTGAGNEHIPAGGTAGQVLTKTAGGYAFADLPAGVRYGTTVPADMKDGELFVRVVG